MSGMSVSIEVPAGTDVRFLVSPLVELGWAAHVLVGADHHPERADWVAGVRGRVPDGLVAWAFTVSAVRATVLADPTLVAPAPLPDQLARLGDLPAGEFADALLRPLLRVRGRPAMRRAELAALPRLARARGTGTVRIVRLLLDDPERARAEFTDLLADCWHAFFRQEWADTAPVLHQAAARRPSRDGWAGAVRDLSPAVHVEPGRLVVDKVRSKRVSAAGRGLVLTPTLFAGPHVYVADEPGRPVVVHYPATPPTHAADRRATLRQLTVLAHPVRLEVCRAIAVEPRSAHEIARLWHLSDTTVTKHLIALRDAGLVETRRTGRFVRYSLHAAAVEQLGADLLEVLRR
jgi:DNA-binding transcriptional ArsR family regulator